MKQLTKVNNNLTNSTLTETVDNRLKGKALSFFSNKQYQNHIINSITEDMVKEEVRKSYHRGKVNFNEEVKAFLSSPNFSLTTSKVYQTSINRYLKWIELNNLNPLSITRIQVDGYIHSLSNLSPSSIRLHTFAVSSLYKFMINRNEKVFSVNPFNNPSIPKPKLTRRQDIISHNDITSLIKEFKRIHRHEMALVVTLLSKYGYRVGIFENMKLSPSGAFTSITKESPIKGKFTLSETRKILQLKILTLRKVMISNIVKKYTTRLFNQNKISAPFSIHDLRHYRITEEVKNCKSGEEIIKVSRRFHKNLTTTMRYVNVA